MSHGLAYAVLGANEPWAATDACIANDGPLAGAWSIRLRVYGLVGKASPISGCKDESTFSTLIRHVVSKFVGRKTYHGLPEGFELTLNP